jgi:hypothetical protein
LLIAAYSETPQVPPGFRADAGTDFDQISAVYWVEHPSAPRVVGSYLMRSTLSAAATLDEALQALQAFLRDGASRTWCIHFFTERPSSSSKIIFLSLIFHLRFRGAP